MLLVANLYAWSGHRFCASQAAFSDEPLSLSRIGLVIDPVFTPCDYAIEGPGLFRVTGSGAQSRPDGELVLLL